MKNAIRKLWNDEAGFVVTVEMILVATLLVIGLVSGITMLRDAVLAELGDTAAAFGAIDQSFTAGGANYNTTEASSAVMSFTDAQDAGDATVVAGVALTAAGSGLAVTVGTDQSAAGLEGTGT